MKLGEYVSYLMISSSGSSCVKASETLCVSHDEVNRFLLSGEFTGKMLFISVCRSIDLYGGTLSGDDSVLDKPYTKRGTTELVGRFYLGKHHSVVQGINIIVLVYTSKMDIVYLLILEFTENLMKRLKINTFRKWLENFGIGAYARNG